MLENLTNLELWEMASYVVTVVGLPFAILVYWLDQRKERQNEEEMNKQTQRLWATWEDYIRFWCRKPDFLAALSDLLEGEDPMFVSYINKIASQTTKK